MIGRFQSVLSNHWKTALAALLLFGATVWLFWPAVSFDYINFDDPQYVMENPYVRLGLHPLSVRWAFTTVHESYWIPLTWLSYMADVSVGGSSAHAHHASNVLLHAMAAVALFLALRRATRSWGPSLAVAALFAWHPLRVESVAWITERKDVLSGVFWFLGVWSYSAYARRPGVVRYLPVCVCMLMGLLAKPMMVSFPFVLLLLDYWPLGRMGAEERDLPRRLPRLLLEKAPLFILSVLFSVTTMLTQSADDAVKGLGQVPLVTRVSDVALAYLFYLGKFIWPAKLAIVYPDLGGRLPVAMLAAALLAGMTWVAVWRRRTMPALLVGWLWFLGVLVPVIGFVRVGTVHVADRFTYIPSVGVALALVWMGRSLVQNKRVAGLILMVLLAGCGVGTRLYLRCWADTESVFQRALDVHPINPIAFEGMGRAMEDQGRYTDALAWYQKTIGVMPDYGEAYANIGNIHGKMGDFCKALEYFEVAERYRPNHPRILNNLGSILYKAGRQDDAIQVLTRAVRLKPDLVDAQYNLALAHLKSGRADEALQGFLRVVSLCPWDGDASFLVGKLLLLKGDLEGSLRWLEKAVQLAPANADALNMYGAALARKGDRASAVRVMREAASIQPDHVEVINNLAWMLATGDGSTSDDALAFAHRAVELTGRQQPHVLDTLAAAYAAAGQCVQAVVTVDEALQLARSMNRPELISRLELRRARYQAGQPWRE